MEHYGAAVNPGRLFCFGGVNDYQSNGKPTHTYEYSILANTQIRRADSLFQFGHYEHCVCYVSNKHRVYIIGGSEQKNCEYYDVKEDAYTQIAPFNDKMK